MKFVISKESRIVALALIIFGLCGILIGVDICRDWDELNFLFILFPSVIFIIGIVLCILNELTFIHMDKEKVIYYHVNKQRMLLKVADVKRLIIWQINFHGAKNEYIIFDDGTFQKADFANKKWRTRKSDTPKSWIAIEYSDKRFDEIRKILRNCPVDIIKPDQY